MKPYRLIFFLGLLVISGLVIGYLVINQTKTRFKSSLAPAYQVIGKSTKSINAALGKIIPVNEMDEAAYGNKLKEYFAMTGDTNDKNYIYLNDLITHLSIYSHKKFKYQVFVYETSVPNAYALPGGVILVTTGLLDIIESESELVSILGHEMGHIEREHCFNAVKYELLMKKIDATTLGKFVDMIISFFMHSSFNKTQENESDEYGYTMLLNSSYDPSGSYLAFKRLYEYANGGSSKEASRKADLIGEYYQSHPHVELRMEKFKKDAENWWKYNKGNEKYIGKRNFEERISYFKYSYFKEWRSE
jgi:predicted Zn-dependent protease